MSLDNLPQGRSLARAEQLKEPRGRAPAFSRISKAKLNVLHRVYLSALHVGAPLRCDEVLHRGNSHQSRSRLIKLSRLDCAIETKAEAGRATSPRADTSAKRH